MTLHPDAQQFLDVIADSGAPPLTSMTPDEARAGSAFFVDLIGAGPEVAVVQDIEIPGPGGAIPARIYKPVPDPVGTVVYYHGGGWVLGCLDEFDPVCQALAVASGARVVSVDYRLAPEHHFPAAVDDDFAALVGVADRHPGLRDEGLAYAAALESAGVPVTVARYEDQIHAFFWLVNVMETADRAVAEAGAAIRDAMAAASA